MKILFRPTLQTRFTIGMVCAGTLLVGYFAYHTLHGAHGYGALVQVREQVAEARATLRQLTDQRERMEIRAGALVTAHRDPDMVDQQARVMLNLAHPNDLVLFYTDD